MCPYSVHVSLSLCLLLLFRICKWIFLTIERRLNGKCSATHCFVQIMIDKFEPGSFPPVLGCHPLSRRSAFKKQDYSLVFNSGDDQFIQRIVKNGKSWNSCSCISVFNDHVWCQLIIRRHANFKWEAFLNCWDSGVQMKGMEVFLNDTLPRKYSVIYGTISFGNNHTV